MFPCGFGRGPEQTGAGCRNEKVKGQHDSSLESPRVTHHPDGEFEGSGSVLGRFIRLVASIGMLALVAACDSAEERAEKHFQTALEYLQEGDLARAAVEFRNVFKFAENHREARTAYARALYEVKEYGPAYRQYLRLVEQYPDDVEGRVRLARLSFLLGDWDEFDRHASEAIRLAPDDPETAPLALARDYRTAILEEDDSLRRATTDRAQVMQEEQPDSIILRRLRIDGYMRDSRFPEALEQIDILLAEDPDNLGLYNQKLQVLAFLGDEGAVEKTLQAMVERFPEEDSVKATMISFYIGQQDFDTAEAFLRSIADPAAEDPGRWVDLIRFLEQIRGPEETLAAIEEGIAQSPRPEIFHALKAGLMFAGGQTEAAIADLEAVLDAREGGEETAEELNVLRITLARMYQATGNEVGSRSLVEAVLAEEPTNAEALKMQAAWAIEADNTDAAIADLRLALDAAPQDANAMTLMAQAYVRAGQPDLARDFLALAVGASGSAPAESVRYARQLMSEESYLAAEDILLPALRLAPRNEEILLTLGELYLAMEDYGRVDQVVSTLRDLETDTGAQAANRVEAALRESRGGAEDAMAFLESLSASGTEDLGAQLSLLRGRLGTGDTDGALQLAERLAEENPDNPLVGYALATTRAALGDFETAIASYRELLAENPGIPRVWLELARLLQASGDREGAVAAVSEGLEVMPESPDLLWARASYLEQDGDIDGAIEIYEQLYERNSNSVIVANNLASLLSSYRDDQESLDRAWTVARRFVGAENPALQDTYGWLLHRRGDYEEALSYLEPAAAGLPGDAITQYHLAETYKALGRTEEALAQYSRVLEVAGPLDDRPQIEAARAALAETPGSVETESAEEPQAEETFEDEETTDGSPQDEDRSE